MFEKETWYDKQLKEYISSDSIAAKVSELGGKITRDYTGKDIVFISVLKGSCIFLSDLVRKVKLPCELDFMIVSSYGNGTKSGEIKIIKDVGCLIEGKDVIIVEDIIDTGNSLNELIKIIRRKNPQTVEICTLLDKKSRREQTVNVKYIGYEIPDEFVVGYGMDYSEKYRNLEFIGILNAESSAAEDSAQT